MRPRLPGCVRANAGFALIAGAMAINTLVTLLICLAVVSGAMPMTTNFFHRLMYGGWSMCAIHTCHASLCLVDVWKPEIWINPRLWQLLSKTEHELAIKHELCHLTRHDNLKLLVLETIVVIYFALPWVRHWAMQYEFDSELSVDNTCRQYCDQDYLHLIFRLFTHQFNAIIVF